MGYLFGNSIECYAHMIICDDMIVQQVSAFVFNDTTECAENIQRELKL